MSMKCDDKLIDSQKMGLKIFRFHWPNELFSGKNTFFVSSNADIIYVCVRRLGLKRVLF